MIDDPEKTDRLVAELKASLPIETKLSQILMRAIVKQSPGLTIPNSCNVVSIFYTGEEGVSCADSTSAARTPKPRILSPSRI
jgi:hypothetical protein